MQSGGRQAIPITDADLDKLVDRAERLLTHINGTKDLEQSFKNLTNSEGKSRTLPIDNDLLFSIRNGVCLYFWFSDWLFEKTGQKAEVESGVMTSDSIKKKQTFSSAYALFVMGSFIVDECKEIIDYHLNSKGKDTSLLASATPNFNFDPSKSASINLQVILNYYVQTLESSDDKCNAIVRNAGDIVSVTRDFFQVVANKALVMAQGSEPFLTAVVNETFNHNDFVVHEFEIEKEQEHKSVSFVPVQPEEVVGNDEAILFLLRLADRLALYDPALMLNPMCEFGGVTESNLLDGPAGCLTGDTKILLLNGTSIPIKELEGIKDFWVYSYSQEEKKMVPGFVVWSGLTKKNSPIVKVTLDNGSQIRCTYDHPFLLKSAVYKNAIELKAGDRIRSIYFWPSDKGYTQYSTGHRGEPGVHDKDFVHKRIAEVKFGERTNYNNTGNLIHHRDEIKINNEPDNLTKISTSQHTREHNLKGRAVAAGSFSFKHRSEESKIEHNRRMINFNSTEHPRLRNDITFELLTQLAPNCWSFESLAKLAGCSQTKVRTTITNTGITWLQFASKYNVNRSEVSIKKNHVVVSVEPCGEEDVYDLTVDKYHNFAIDDGEGNGVFTHNTGKTTLIKMMLTRLNKRCDQIELPFYSESLTAAEIKSEWYGKSGKLLADKLKAIMSPTQLAVMTIDDIDLLIGQRDSPGSGGADKDLLKGLMDFFAGVGANYKGNYTSLAATNKATGFDDALRQRFVYRVLVKGAESWEDQADLVALQLRKVSKEGLVSISEQGYTPLKRAKISTIFANNLQAHHKGLSYKDIGNLILELKGKDEHFTARSVKNAIDVTIAKSSDFDIPEEWFTKPELFRKLEYKQRLQMLKDMFHPITTDQIIAAIEEQFDSEQRYKTKKYVN